jgi:hypothetical protein
VMKDLSRTFLTQEEVRVVQCPGVVGQVDFDVVCIHHAVAVDVDLKRRVGTGHVHPRLGMRRRHRSVERGRVHEVNRAGEAVRTSHVREREVVLVGVAVQDLVAVSGLGLGGRGEVEVDRRGPGCDRVRSQTSGHGGVQSFGDKRGFRRIISRLCRSGVQG